MATDPRVPATARDLDATPDDGRIYEILDGQMEVQPRPRPEHNFSASALTTDLFAPFGRGHGGPGGWWILFEPEIALGARDIVVPDLAGWRRERLPTLPSSRIELVPDWACEVISPSSQSRDRVRKSDLYLRSGVRHYWLIDPEARTFEALEAREGGWWRLGGRTDGGLGAEELCSRRSPHGTDAGFIPASEPDGDVVRVAPFEAVEIDVGALFVPLPAPPAGETP